MPEGVYTIKAYLPAYVQTEFPAHTVTFCSNGSMSMHLIRGAIISATIYSRDCEDPSVEADWLYGDMYAPIVVAVENVDTGAMASVWMGTQLPGVSSVTGGWFGLLLAGGSGPKDYWRYPMLHQVGGATGTYRIHVYTVGYVQYISPEVHVTQGTDSIADVPVYLQVGGRIKLNVDFKFEMLPVGLIQDHHSYYFRLRAFDADGNLAAANITAVPAKSPGPNGLWGDWDDVPTVMWSFMLVGFSRFTTPMYAGTPADGGYFDSRLDFPKTGTWFQRVGYYEPTDIKSLWDTGFPTSPRGPNGIPPGTYTVVIEEELTRGRYVQLEEIEVVVTCAGQVERTFEVDQAPLISGSIYTRNFMMDFRNGSWIPVSMSGSPDVSTSSQDGVYWSYYPLPGSQLVTVGLPGDLGYVSQSTEIATTWGATSNNNNFWLEESGIPIPEFPVAIFALISALAASLFLIRWRRETIVSVR
jgi:hypothetical protein